MKEEAHRLKEGAYLAEEEARGLREEVRRACSCVRLAAAL